MTMKKSLIIVGLIICVILIAILINFFNPPKPVIPIVGNEERAISMAKNGDVAKRFLTLYPDANISCHFVSCNGPVKPCPTRCLPLMGATSVSHYVVEFSKKNTCIGIVILDEGVKILNSGEEWKFLLENEKNCYGDDDCKCWFGCGCDIPPKRGCVCETDEYYCLNYLYAAENEIHKCDEEMKCKCINNTCTLQKKETTLIEITGTIKPDPKYVTLPVTLPIDTQEEALIVAKACGDITMDEYTEIRQTKNGWHIGRATPDFPDFGITINKDTGKTECIFYG